MQSGAVSAAPRLFRTVCDPADIPTQLRLRCQFSPNEEQNDRANDRQDEARWIKRRTWLRFGEQTSDPSPDDRAADPKEARHSES